MSLKGFNFGQLLLNEDIKRDCELTERLMYLAKEQFLFSKVIISSGKESRTKSFTFVAMGTKITRLTSEVGK